MAKRRGMKLTDFPWKTLWRVFFGIYFLLSTLWTIYLAVVFYIYANPNTPFLAYVLLFGTILIYAVSIYLITVRVNNWRDSNDA